MTTQKCSIDFDKKIRTPDRYVPERKDCVLSELFANSQIAIRQGAIFRQVPESLDSDRLRRDERIEGMILGLAVGDALGHSTEWKYDPEKRWKEYGTITDHVGTFLSPAGRISDDTQLSLWTLERLLAKGSLDIHDLTACLTARRRDIVGAGRNTTQALDRHYERMQHGTPEFHLCGGDALVDGRGNGALMRFSPLVLPHLRNPSPAYWSDVTLAAFITHPHSAALSSVLAFAGLLWQILNRPTGDAPAPEWWIDEYIRIAGDLEFPDVPLAPCLDPVPSILKNFRGTLCEFIDTKVRKAWRTRMNVRDACSLKGFGSNADCVQSVPATLYVLMSHADSFESAVISSVNDTKDNDTIASIVGAILGALHGRQAIRKRWVEGIRSNSLKTEGNFAGDDRTIIKQLASDAVNRFL